MDVVERLTLEAARADTMLACEHRHRYEFAASLCRDLRVLDLCCGSGYGSAILAGSAASAVGVDNHAASIEAARASVGRELSNVSFEVADAIAFLADGLGERFDAVVCFEGLEHLDDVGRALALLQGHAERGMRVVASVPNSRLFGERNRYHATDFGYDEAVAAFAGFPEPILVPQFLAEGSLICPPQADGTDVTVSLEDRDELEYANHFIFAVNFQSEAVEGFHHGRVQASVAPVFNRWAEDTKRALAALHHENARLARARLGKAQSAAASALAALPRDQASLEAELDAWKDRCFNAEARVEDLEVELGRRGHFTGGGLRALLARPMPDGVPVTASTPGTGAVADRPATAELVAEPNSWEARRRRAAEHLIPWIERTVPLAGRTVLEYGCGNAAVSCALAERAEGVIGLDIDADWIERGRREAAARGLDNVELELHPVEGIFDAVAARRGQVDVFLCYAVLEHMRVAERLALLRLAREVVRPDGAIVVCETPNRLTYLDHHTAQMPFFHLLPDELALAYHDRSARADFRAAIAGAEDRLEAIARWGRGVSFHEFEVAFGDLSRHVLASSYDPLLFAERPVQPEEMILARYLGRVRPDLAPAWSRAWLDVILAPQPLERRPSFLRPWSADTSGSHGVSWTGGETLALGGPDATLWIELPHPTDRLVVGTLAPGKHLEVRVRGESMAAPLAAVAEGRPGRAQYTSFALPTPAQRLALSAGEASHVVFVGYED